MPLTLFYQDEQYVEYEPGELLSLGVPQEVIDAAIAALAVPQILTAKQLRLALLGAGLLETVDSAIKGLPEPDRSVAEISWEYATEFERYNPLIVAVAQAAQKTDAEIDALFVAGARL